MKKPPRLPVERGDGEEASFLRTIEGETDFEVRRAVERLREGLFDPMAVRLLTAHEERLDQEMIEGLDALEKDRSHPHLCLVGAYGQGKSHSLLYLQELALRENLVTASINLDPREIPFHNFREVYRALMRSLKFPGSQEPFPEIWKRWARGRIEQGNGPSKGIEGLFPENMPHLFRCLLAAMVSTNGSFLQEGKMPQKKDPLLPRDIPFLLARALEGEPIPVHRLKKIFDHQGVAFHRNAPLACRGHEPFWEMTRALSCLFRQMGYRGWVLLLDEGESMVQGGVVGRSKSYKMLHRVLDLEVLDRSGSSFLYPVFAFTEDFFHQVRREDYQRIVVRRGQEMPLFDRDYAEEWRNLRIYRLYDLSGIERQVLARKLTHLHARAYRWQPPLDEVTRELFQRLEAMKSQETRLQLKTLVHCLDLAQQELILPRKST